MISFNVHSNTCHEKFEKTSFGNMGCFWITYKLGILRRRLRREYMVNRRILITCFLGCVNEKKKVIRDQLWS